MHKKIRLIIAVLGIAGVMVAPVVVGVNLANVVVADGSPVPAPVPHPPLLVADGSPVPAPVPHPPLMANGGSIA